MLSLNNIGVRDTNCAVKNPLVIYNQVSVFVEKAMAPHSSILAWKIPWMEEPGRLQSMGSLRVGHDWATSLSLFTFTFHFHFSLSCIGEGNGNPLQCSCLENPRDGGAWWAVISGVVQSRTWLKQFSSSLCLRFLFICSHEFNQPRIA